MKSVEEIYTLFSEKRKVITDSRLASQGGLFFALKGDNFNGNKFALSAIEAGADYAIVDDPDLSEYDKVILVDDVLLTLQKLANYHRRKLKIPILAITGTNGKTTTKELISAVLNQKFNTLSTNGNLNNHIGVPLTLLSIYPDHEIAVIEMGANHPGEIERLCLIAEPDWGLVTNVGKAHLEGFGSFDGVKKAKAELYEYIFHSGKGVFINTGNRHLMEMLPNNISTYTYAVNSNSADISGEVVENDIMLKCRVNIQNVSLEIKTKLTGEYNIENVLAASSIGYFFGVDLQKIKAAIEEYQPSNSRSQILKIGSSTLIIDCYNANPTSMEVSLLNFFKIEGQEKALILGEMLELGESSGTEHQKIIDLIMKNGIKNVCLIGKCFYDTISPPGYLKFNDIEEMKLKTDFYTLKDRLILIKGSRGNKLEKVIEEFQ